jgi:hypothetical protein
MKKIPHSEYFQKKVECTWVHRKGRPKHIRSTNKRVFICSVLRSRNCRITSKRLTRDREYKRGKNETISMFPDSTFKVLYQPTVEEVLSYIK